MVTEDTVQHVARLAKLQLNEQEIAANTEHFSRLLSMVAAIEAVDVEDVEPLSHPGEPTIQMRKDEAAAQGHEMDLMALAPASEDGLFQVPKVVE